MATQQDLIRELKEKQKERAARLEKKGLASPDFKQELNQAVRKRDQRLEEKQRPSGKFKEELQAAAAKRTNDPAVARALEKSMAKNPVQGRRYTPMADARQNSPYQGGLVEYGKHKKPGTFKSTDTQLAAIPRYTKPQQNVLDIVNGYLGNKQNNPLGQLNLPGNNQNSFDPIRNAELNRFSQRTGPTIAERFQSLGGRDFEPGALSSGPLRNQLWNAENDLRLQLAGQEAQYNLQNQAQQANNYFNLLQTGSAPQYDTNTIGGQNSAIRNVALGGLNAGLGYATGGLSGAASGLANYVSGQPNNFQQQNNQQQTSTQPAPTPSAPMQLTNSLNPYQVQNSVAQGYMNQLTPQGNNPYMNQNPNNSLNNSVRGFGNRGF